eukprot:TRINITY_DN5665_c1_g1_i3.p1 TRINITY_DN5665_c1_g1~~TRINITY_DN5665_c1_g1_i3.p1  ORF type:complete len:105 (-),score=11.12 TRINITY_DN5665_c1_g1_i3:105-419(-)
MNLIFISSAISLLILCLLLSWRNPNSFVVLSRILFSPQSYILRMNCEVFWHAARSTPRGADESVSWNLPPCVIVLSRFGWFFTLDGLEIPTLASISCVGNYVYL